VFETLQNSTEVKSAVEIHLPLFSGNVHNFKAFKSSFSRIIDESRMTKMEKFHYLRSKLEGNVIAEIKALIVSEENYDAAWELLCARYDNPRAVVETCFLQLQNHPPTKPHDET
jgi:hypothetical protein